MSDARVVPVPAGSGPIFLNDVACSGTESTLKSCIPFTGINYCTHSGDVGIHCEGRRCQVFIMRGKVPCQVSIMRGKVPCQVFIMRGKVPCQVFIMRGKVPCQVSIMSGKVPCQGVHYDWVWSIVY